VLADHSKQNILRLTTCGHSMYPLAYALEGYSASTVAVGARPSKATKRAALLDPRDLSTNNKYVLIQASLVTDFESTISIAHNNEMLRLTFQSGITMVESREASHVRKELHIAGQ
jgi:hypothetical protein